MVRLPARLGAHTEFVGNVATMMSGKAVAAMIALITMPIVARLFTPADFGVAAAFTSIVGIAGVIATLRYEAAIVLPKTDSEARVLASLAHGIAIATCVGLLLLLSFYEALGASWGLLELLGGWVWLLPLGVFLTAAIHVQQTWLARKKAFRMMAGTLALENASNSGMRIALGASFGSSVYGLIGGQLFGMLCRLAVQKTSPSYQSMRQGRVDWEAMRACARRYADFPKLNAPAGLVFMIGQRLPVLVFATMFSPAVAGFYAMANRLCTVPAQMVAASLRTVFLQKTAAIHNANRSLWKAYGLATIGLACLGVPAFGVLWLYGGPLLTWLLGERWGVAGSYIEIMAPWLFMIWVMAPCNAIFIVLRQQKFWLTLQLLSTFLRVGALGGAYIASASPESTLRVFVLAAVIAGLFTIVTTFGLILRQPVGTAVAVSVDDDPSEEG